MKDFGTSQSTKIDSIFDRLLCPDRPAYVTIPYCTSTTNQLRFAFHGDQRGLFLVLRLLIGCGRIRQITASHFTSLRNLSADENKLT
ncbi:MAG: hypothetical protein KZQ66_09100 [Candidatus Thiodiazotropha sp. (ex Lucinoma aequizonata)]|nr:hypothetical protein [Candidatus Thiodiazotropha sp. (ex Lucinoma aequizonata)]MCU7888989.1 hypothetical protein [Candidatus Thiodiazotropha sp. (ex Lucinoma aequizonata)]MCU7895660.1 hypothetical protein [Candidatus Thiodiazotropha sp. (ex Lucinoma aequizonata)]MCU7897691.1 hypothetical protein [Candidatus Thiodiazotropha sp. (ex Lucinoma aequizonata)]MCU7902128.1 hypothetical protein [Candidatus Thiodiazotropha sp. (ex Lucinoma aequizonata)]